MSNGDAPCVSPEDELRRRLYAQARSELLERQFSNCEAYDKAVLTLSSFTLGLSLAFIKDIVPAGAIVYAWLLYFSWIALALAIVFTVASFRVSDAAINEQQKRAHRYYMERDDTALERTASARNVEILNNGSGLLFVLGIVLTIAFAIVSMSEVRAMSQRPTNDSGVVDFGQGVPTMQKVIVYETRGQSVPLMQQVPQNQPVAAQPVAQPVQSGTQAQQTGTPSTGSQSTQK